MGTEFPVLAIRLLQEKVKAEVTCIALVFVDARQEFYGIVRKLVLSVVEIDQAVVSLFEQLRILREAIEELTAIFAKGPAMENSTFSALTVRDIAPTFTANHFEVKGSNSLGSAHKGARPGHPYVVVVFSLPLI